MELLTGSGPAPTDVVHFEDNFNSFPGNSAEIRHWEINPPIAEFLQVNYTGHNLTDFSNSGLALDKILPGCSDELGFLAQLACQDAHELFKVNSSADQNATRTNRPPALEQMRTETAAEDGDITSQGRFLEAELSQVTRKQDQMHKQLMEMVERKEKERIMLEEAWKKQEIERAKVDEEERTRETLRSLALISFIQNLSYHDVEIPYASESSCREKDCIGIQNHDFLKDESSNRRWPKTEVQALITVRMAIERKFLVKRAKGSGWKEVAAELGNLGYNRTPEKCREKWENINKYYKRTVESGKKRRRSLPYFEELDVIHRRGRLAQWDANS